MRSRPFTAQPADAMVNGMAAAIAAETAAVRRGGVGRAGRRPPGDGHARPRRPGGGRHRACAADTHRPWDRSPSRKSHLRPSPRGARSAISGEAQSSSRPSTSLRATALSSTPRATTHALSEYADAIADIEEGNFEPKPESADLPEMSVLFHVPGIVIARCLRQIAPRLAFSLWELNDLNREKPCPSSSCSSRCTGRPGVLEAELSASATLGELHDALAAAGVNVGCRDLIFIDEAEEPLAGESSRARSSG